MGPTRRAFLRGVAGAAGLVMCARCGSVERERRRVGIVGGGMSGVATAWLLADAFDVVLFEARAELGGNVRVAEVDVRGGPVSIDLGAQYFHPGPHPTYLRLLERLGLFRSEDRSGDRVFESPSTITVLGRDEEMPRFVSPSLPERGWPLTEVWNQSGLTAFLALTSAGRALEVDGSYAITVDEWLPTLALDDDAAERVLLPWIASLYSGDLGEARGYSARSALTFLTRAIGSRPLDPVTYLTLEGGMRAVLEAMASEARALVMHLGAPVDAITHGASGWRVSSGGLSEDVDVLVIAAPAFAAGPLLDGVSGLAPQRDALAGIAFHDAEIVLHRDPLYAHASPRYWSFLNAATHGGSAEASMWLASAVASADGAPIDVWKSWVTHRDVLPATPLAAASFRHMLPTPSTLASQAALLAHQGDGELYFVGGTTRAYDSQETALLSAMSVARSLGATSARLTSLETAAPR